MWQCPCATAELLTDFASQAHVPPRYSVHDASGFSPEIARNPGLPDVIQMGITSLNWCHSVVQHCDALRTIASEYL